MPKILEVTTQNEEQYLDQIVELEEIVLQKMIKEGRVGQLFTTGKEDISKYVQSDENTVMIAVNDDGSIGAAAYITQGQKPFTYNDITKYFKTGEGYKRYIKSKYQSKQQYLKDLLEIYEIKLKAFENAKNRILQEEKYENIGEYLQQEILENEFHEKSNLREKINEYMSEYIIENYGEDIQEKYEQFYWITSEEISKEFDRPVVKKCENAQEYEQFIQAQVEYEEILKKAQLKILEKPNFDITKYYTANTQNSIELDTYITGLNNRNRGLGRILVFEGIKKHINRFFEKKENNEIFLCSTLHRDNWESRYVSEFFGLKDSLFVNRRQGRDREVHICRVTREEVTEYLAEIYDKLAVLCRYNPENKKLPESTVEKILEEENNKFKGGNGDAR